jgi:hypothetical protein
MDTLNNPRRWVDTVSEYLAALANFFGSAHVGHEECLFLSHVAILV